MLLTNFDIWATSLLNVLSARSVLLDDAMVVVTKAGVPVLVMAVALLWWSRRDRQNTRHAVVAAGLSFVGGLLLNQLLLLFVHRVRPYDAGVTHLIISPSADWSFPSDHATAAVAITAAFLLNRDRQRGLMLLVAAGLICFSRVFVGTHYVSDVVGGATTGAVAAVTLHQLYRRGTRFDTLITGLL
jgi:undecaprenyl-diphosphatase